MKNLALYWQILIAFGLSVLYGLFFSEHVHLVAWMGDIFIKALKMIIIPLIFTSIISGIANVGSGDNLGRLGFKTIAYYLSTSTAALFTGLVIVNIFKPGVGADLGFANQVEGLGVAKESFGSTLMNIVPDNLFVAMVENQMLSIIFFAILMGFFITKTKEKSQKILLGFFDSLFELIMKITLFVIRFTPYGIFGIVAKQIAENNDLGELFSRLGLFMLVVILALFIHAFIVLPIVLKTIGRVSPIKHFNAMRTPLITAFSTSSSNATLPLTMNAVKKNSGVSTKISSFTLPLGATVNMDGTALYELVAAMFIAQAYGIELTFTEQIIGVLTGLLASIGAAGIPMAGLVMISVVLSAMGLPLEGVGLILAVDRLLDMFRTTVNVWSDSCGAVIIAKSEGEKLNV
ncbi:MAG: dicarboxylate/amino acid:cation symporter [Flavobacteriaceae bacterium]|mgnify:FL=1|nr:dicarboxylate/amino acid:cation symporter [Flavobacteriaceae bacterium]|tara:strand:+ start:5035 stop:6246 length:1212 start_codon:yes stop_codon:yes gene_type:complete